MNTSLSSSASSFRASRRHSALRTTLLSAFATLGATLTAPSAFALTWDITSGDNPTITDGSGNWNTTAGNLVWNNNANPNVIWSQTSGTVGTQSAVFGTVGGTDGTVDQWTVTLGAAMAATSTTFNITGYKITGSTLTTGAITVLSGKTATINSAIAATGTNAIAGTLNLGGGGAFSGTSNWNGAGTLSITGGTFTGGGSANFNNAITNQTGGSVTNTSGTVATQIGNNPGRNVNYTISGTGLLSANNGNANGLTIGRSSGAFLTTLTVQSGGTVNVGTTTLGNMVLGAGGVNGKLDVQGGDVTIGTGNAANVMILFNNNGLAGNTAAFTQSGGNVTANGISLGTATGTYDATSNATIQLSGGNLYVGALGIAKGSAAAALPYSIQLQGGTLGASATWNSTLDMKLGTTGGGPTIKAADASNVAKNITLSGNLSNDTGVNGTLTKTGGGILTLSGAANTYDGTTSVNAGTLALSGSGTAGTAGSQLDINGGTLDLGGTTQTKSGVIRFLSGTTSNGTITKSGAAYDAQAGTVSAVLGGSAGLTKTTTGILTLSGNNTYSGLTTISVGQLSAKPAALSPNTSFSVASGGQLYVNAGLSTIANNFTLSGTGTSDVTTTGITGGVGALRVFNNLIFTGTMDLAGDTRIGVNGGSVTNTFNGTISGVGGLEFLASVTANNITQTYVLGNTGTANSYAGNTTLSIGDSGGARTGGSTILKLASSDQIPNGAGKGIVVFNGTDANHKTILELNAQSETINGVSNVSATGAVIQNTSNGTSTLTIGDNDTSSSFSGVITDAGVGKTLALTKIGSGTLSLSGTNSYTGATTVNGGSLTIANGLASGNALTVGASGTADFQNAGQTLGAVSISNTATNALNFSATSGTVTLASLSGAGNTNFGSNATVTGAFSSGTVTVGGVATIGTMSSGTATLNGGTSAITTLNGGTVNLASGTVLSVSDGTSSGSINGTGGAITKVSPGTLTLSGTNTYTGATIVSDGILNITGSGSINGTSGITVSGGTFKNNSSVALTPGLLTFTSGTVSGTNFTGVAITIGAGQTVSPGNSPGNLVAGATTFANDGNYNWQVLDAGGVAGTGFDTMSLDAGVTLTIGATSANPFNINLWSLSSSGPDVNGNASGFVDTNSYSWTIVSTDQSIAGFAANKFLVNAGVLNGTGGFSNTFAGTFGVALSGDNTDLLLTYTPIPEPSAFAAMAGLGMIGAALYRRRQRVKAA